MKVNFMQIIIMHQDTINMSFPWYLTVVRWYFLVLL